jgi:hypothetical protein
MLNVDGPASVLKSSTERIYHTVSQAYFALHETFHKIPNF